VQREYNLTILRATDLKLAKGIGSRVIQVEVFWVVTPCSVVAGYQRFGGPCCLHLEDEMYAIRITLQLTGSE